MGDTLSIPLAVTLLGVACGLAACVTPDASTADVKIVHESTGVARCQRLDTVRGNGVAELRTKTASMGGSHLLVIDASTGTLGAAYRC